MTKGCELNYALGCGFLGNLYTNNGPMVKKDLRKATQYYSKACELNLGVSCSLLGFLYQNGNGVKKDLKKAFALYAKACGLKDGDGCLRLRRDATFWRRRSQK